MKKMITAIARFLGILEPDQTLARPEPLSDNLLRIQTIRLTSCESVDMKLVGLKTGETLRQKSDSLETAGIKIAELKDIKSWFQSNWEAKRMDIIIASPRQMERRGFRGVISQVPAIGRGASGFQEGYIDLDSAVANNDKIFILTFC